MPPLHPWGLSPADAVAVQAELAARVDTATPLGRLDTVAGCDVAYDIGSTTVHAAVVVVRVADLTEIERVVVRRAVGFPYVPGLLSFRELPPLLDAWELLRTRPDCVMLDAQGIAHPRRFGLACHLGLWLDRPAVGCAKSRLVGEFAEPGPAAGDASPLLVGGEPVGWAVRSAAGAKPVFVSPGHQIDRDGALAVVRAVLSGHRQPVPTRLAHMAANAARAAAGSGPGAGTTQAPGA